MPRKLIEAALFMSSKAMTPEEIARITGVPARNVERLLEGLRREYDSGGKGVEIIRNPEGWEMRVKPELLPKVAHLTPYSDLRNGHKRTLALVAYKEPIKQSDVIRIQGNKAYSYIRFLRRKGLVKSEKEGRTAKLSLTKEFERYFGEEKQRIKEMLEQGVKKMREQEKAKGEKEKREREPVPAQKPAQVKTGQKLKEGKPEEAKLEKRPEPETEKMEQKEAKRGKKEGTKEEKKKKSYSEIAEVIPFKKTEK